MITLIILIMTLMTLFFKIKIKQSRVTRTQYRRILIEPPKRGLDNIRKVCQEYTNPELIIVDLTI